jgi:hypothetical protein
MRHSRTKIICGTTFYSSNKINAMKDENKESLKDILEKRVQKINKPANEKSEDVQKKENIENEQTDAEIEKTQQEQKESD